MKKCPKCGELNGDSVQKCFNCFFDFSIEPEIFRKQEELFRQQRIAEQNRLIEEQRKNEEKVKQERKNFIKNNNLMYEYDVISIVDRNDGSCDATLIQRTISSKAADKWRLHTIFTNEIGKNSSSGGYGGISSGTNATIDQTIMVFERIIGE